MKCKQTFLIIIVIRNLLSNIPKSRNSLGYSAKKTENRMGVRYVKKWYNTLVQ